MTAILDASKPQEAELVDQVETAEARHVCANCGAERTTPFCGECGQKGHLHGRLWHLIEDFAEGVAHFDGRLWRTLPLLIFRPGRLSRAWIEGKRVRYVAPLHLFLFSIFAFFLVESLTPDREGTQPEASAPAASVATRGDPAPAEDRAAQSRERVGESGQGARRTLADRAQALADSLDAISRKSEQDERYYDYKFTSLIYKLSFAVIPISMVILLILTGFRRNVTLYDHAVVALYGVGFLAMLSLAGGLLGQTFGGRIWWGVWALAFAHAVAHLRGAYRLSWPGAVARGLGLGVLTAIGFFTFAIVVQAIAVSS